MGGGEGRHGHGAGEASFFSNVGAGTRFYIGESGTGVGFFSALWVRVATSLSAAVAAVAASSPATSLSITYVGFSVGSGAAAQGYGSFIGGMGGGGGGGGLFGCGLFAGSGVGLQTVSVSS